MIKANHDFYRKTNDWPTFAIWLTGNVDVCKIKCELNLHYVRLWKAYLRHCSQEEDISRPRKLLY